MNKIEKKNIFLKNKQETDVNFRLFCTRRNGIYESLKDLTKQSSTRYFLNIDLDILENGLSANSHQRCIGII